MKSIVWFRQDLRLADNPALTAAAAQGEVLPVFIHAPEEEKDFPTGGAGKWWLHHSLERLQQSVGGTLVLRMGASLDELRKLVRESGAQAVHWNRRYEPAAIARDAGIKQALRADGVTVESHSASLLFEPMQVANKSGKPFQVFTPFYRHCLTLPKPAKPAAAPKLHLTQAETLSLESLQLLPTVNWASGMAASWQPGEAGAHKQLARMLDGHVEQYVEQRDLPDRVGTSRLSPHLHWGEIGPRQIWHAVRERCGDGGEMFLRQLVWREFAHHLLFHFPHTPLDPLRSEFARFPWRQSEALLRAWQKGMTGYPIVDAGMRELWTTGWMHNRVRMIVASFLVKHLRLPWQEGAFWFWDTLLDADLANNTLGWQWSAGCGADAAPYFRIFNPVLQGEKFDAEGHYVQQWVPELRGLSKRWLHQPWNAPAGELARAGVELGRTYPRPVVEHAKAREEALAAFQSLRSDSAYAAQES
jgi:deoxyribodipyrimidine photo-lyase